MPQQAPRQRYWIAALLIVALASAPGGALAVRLGMEYKVRPWPMPEFPALGPEAWVNTPPLSRKDLHGKVVLLEVWTTS